MSSVSLSLLERMAVLSTRMVEAASAQDWTALVNLEHEVSVLRKAGETPSTETEADATALRKKELIEQMLADQQRILDHVRPWMNDTRKELRDGTRSRVVHAAYTAHGF